MFVVCDVVWWSGVGWGGRKIGSSARNAYSWEEQPPATSRLTGPSPPTLMVSEQYQRCNECDRQPLASFECMWSWKHSMGGDIVSWGGGSHANRQTNGWGSAAKAAIGSLVCAATISQASAQTLAEAPAGKCEMCKVHGGMTNEFGCSASFDWGHQSDAVQTQSLRLLHPSCSGTHQASCSCCVTD